MKQISSGAEAIIYKDENIIKDRVKKDYRIPEIDVPLRQFRTRRESKVLTRLEEIGFSAPKLVKTDRKSIIEMEEIPGEKVRNVLIPKMCKEIGKKIAILHNNNIVHGDLTTSNMILNKEVYLIDFGLSKFSEKIEDKAVDIHLFRQALESKHDQIWEECYKIFLDEYNKNADRSKEIMTRLDKIELRGRNKSK